MSDLVERLVNLYHLRFVPTVKRMCARRRLAYTLLTAGILCLSASVLSMLVLHGAGLLSAYAEMEEAFRAFLADSRTPVEKLPDMEKILASSKAASLVAAGMGIGLSACHGIIQAHNGFFTAENDPEGGAVFRFGLPMEVSSHE